MEKVNKGGRPSKFTPERRQAILDAISKRIPYILAAESNGICEDTLYDWIKKGIEDRNNGIDSEFAKFSEDIKRTEREKIEHHLNKLDENVKNWQSDAWILERRWPKLFGANSHITEFNERLAKLEQAKIKKEEA